VADELFISPGCEYEAIKWFADKIKDGYKKVVITSTKRRSQSQNAFQHSIYGEISRYLISKGRTDCDADWVKKALKNQFLGWELEEYTNLLTGEITTKEVLKRTSKLGTGEAHYYTEQIIAWASGIGCEIKIPAKCEYRDIQERQNR
tara:strand:- start:2 stop:442 length:441 start_codon:yes stop_codon:yes gene_type:complete